MNLYSYCLRFDDGAAPNPYWGICTLAICKPAIRRTAEVGDWVVGLGSKKSPIGDISKRVVYAMKVTMVLSMREYDTFCRKSLSVKIPEWTKSDFRLKVGDCIYEFGHRLQPTLRRSVHTEANRGTDLGGKQVLLSTQFYYFGDKPVDLPQVLQPLVHSTQGHKSRANTPYLNTFVTWIEDGGWVKNAIYGQPQLKDKIMSMNEEDCRISCSKQDKKENERDEIC